MNPVMADLPDQNALEQTPQEKFHASSKAIRHWLFQMEITTRLSHFSAHASASENQ